MGRSPDAQARTASQTRHMAQVRVNGVTLYYEEHGAGAPILGIHGAGSSAAFWSDAAARLAKHGRTIVYDRRGCSRSERPKPYTTNVHQQADDAAALIEALDAAPAVVIGRSYGGAVALDLALRYPGLVRALVQLEGDAGISLSETAMRELAELRKRIFAAADVDIGSVAETVVRAVAGDALWEDLPDEAK
jgi:esterase